MKATDNSFQIKIFVSLMEFFYVKEIANQLGCTNSSLDFNGFMSFYRKFSIRPELAKILEEITFGDETITSEKFQFFLKNCQQNVK